MKLRWKILITIFLAILASYLWNSIPYTGHKTNDDSPTTGRLSDAYRYINEDYFYGGLPGSKTQIILVDLTAQGDEARIEQRPDGTWLISIDPNLDVLEKQAEMSMVHEMCHQEDFVRHISETIDNHGPAFQACMIRVAIKGGFKRLW